MCAYKIVRVRFEVWGFQTRVEDFTQRVEWTSSCPIGINLLFFSSRLCVIFSFLHIDKHLHGWMNGKKWRGLITLSIFVHQGMEWVWNKFENMNEKCSNERTKKFYKHLLQQRIILPCLIEIQTKEKSNHKLAALFLSYSKIYFQIFRYMLLSFLQSIVIYFYLINSNSLDVIFFPLKEIQSCWIFVT